MQLTDYVIQVQSQLASAAALGDEATRATAEALSTAAEPAVRLAVLAAVSAAADEITAALLDVPGAPVVTVHLDGPELRVDVRPTQQAEPPDSELSGVAASTDEADATARISLRLSEALKGQIEAAARNRSVSVNSWLVQAATAALASPSSPGWGRSWSAGPAHRVTGWING
ncbi:MAG TPA: hypothetical protein VFN80_03425 [Acidothermaceae bacterium]|nr:hypothetical protein [Acidothermaceae bacterium]